MDLKKPIMLAVILFLSLPYSVYPREAARPPEAVDEHTKTMLKQHEAMLSLQTEWDKAKKAVKRKNPGAALPPASKMEHSARYLDKFMLHKNAEKRGEFLIKAARFQGLVKKFKERAERGDNASLKKLIPKIDNACNGCHKTFR